MIETQRTEINKQLTNPVLEVRELRKSYGAGPKETKILDGLNFEVLPGEFVCVVGPSGSGKTTLLRNMAGLLPPSSGEVIFEGSIVTGPPEKMAVVFQDYSRSLLPWKTIHKNVELPLLNIMDRPRRTQVVEEVLNSVGLAGKGHLYPWQMSGGMQQRAAIARGLAFQPKVLLMDEPFAAVDAQTRIELEDLVLEVRDKFDMTIVFVTHDIDEAVYLADRVVVLSGAPTKVSENLVVDLHQPRDQVHTKADPRYAVLRNQVFDLIQTAKSHAVPTRK